MTTINTTREAIDALEEMRERVESVPPTEELESKDVTLAIKAGRVLDHASTSRTFAGLAPNLAEVAEVNEWRKWLYAHSLPTRYRP